jgi:hypothetical protein
MKAGLLGAIGGVGKALEGFGSDLQKRREQALEDARELAKEQSRQAIRSEERQQDRELRVDMFVEGQKAQDRRSATNQAAITGRATQSQEFQRSERQERAKEARALADYKNGLATDRTIAGEKRRAALAAGKPKGLRPGRIRKSDGFVEVLGVRGDNQIYPTGQWVTPEFFKSTGQNFGKAGGGGSMVDQLDLEDEDEDEEE